MVRPIKTNRRGKSWRFPKKYYTLLFGAIMGLIMSLLTSLAKTLSHLLKDTLCRIEGSIVLSRFVLRT
jgi:hypothetical protein